MARGKKGTKDPELTEKQFEQLSQWLTLGLTITDVCVLASISRETFYKWFNEGKKRTDPRDPVKLFADAVAKGKTSAKAYALGHVQLGMKKDWKAAAWYLGVTHPKAYGPKIKVTLDAEFGAALERLKKALPGDMYELALHAIAGSSGEDGADALSPGEDGGIEEPRP